MKIYAREKLSKFLRILLIILLMAQLNGKDNSLKNDTGNNVKENRSLEKSLIFPGLGQIHEKKYFKGALFITAELITITGAFINNHLGNKNYNYYRSSKTGYDTSLYRIETERFDKNRNLFIATGIGIWMINMLDIYLFKKKMQKSKLKMTLNRGINDEIFFTLNYSF